MTSSNTPEEEAERRFPLGGGALVARDRDRFKQGVWWHAAWQREQATPAPTVTESWTEEIEDEAERLFNTEQLQAAYVKGAQRQLARYAPALTSSERAETLRTANIARQAEWDQDNAITLEYRGNELAGEVGEACNVIKKLARERIGIRGSRATKEQLAEELADVVICADLIAMHEGIDLLNEAVPAKFNATSEKYGLSTRLAARFRSPAPSGLRTDGPPRQLPMQSLDAPFNQLCSGAHKIGGEPWEVVNGPHHITTTEVDKPRPLDTTCDAPWGDEAAREAEENGALPGSTHDQFGKPYGHEWNGQAWVPRKPAPRAQTAEGEALERVSRAIYEADHEGGYDAEDPKTFWMAEDGYWPPSTKMVIWENWLNMGRAALSALPQAAPAGEPVNEGHAILSPGNKVVLSGIGPRSEFTVETAPDPDGVRVEREWLTALKNRLAERSTGMTWQTVTLAEIDAILGRTP